MQTLYLIDGYAQFFRAYHAIRTPMTSPVTGEPTNMTYGFVGMLLKLLRGASDTLTGDGAPAALAVALDVSGDRGTFRSRLYPAYKATREEPPEDLKPQVERALSILEAIGVPVLGSEGFEADDVIATIATTYSARHPDVRVRIISKDKDLKQLLGSGTPPTEMYDVHTDALITESDLLDELGIRPDQVVDLLTLMGDTSDNIPGVEGIGIKTAAKLLAEHGDLDSVVAAAESGAIKGKRGEKILAAREQLPLSKRLVTLRRDVPIDLELDEARARSFAIERLVPICRELGFNRYQDEIRALLKRDEAGPQGGAGFGTLFEQKGSSDVDGRYTIVTTEKDLGALVDAIERADLLAVDTETTALRPMWADLAGISLACEEGSAWYVPILAPEGETVLSRERVLDALRPVLSDASVPKVGHNIKYDAIVLENAGVVLRGHQPSERAPRAGDTMIASFILEPTRSSHAMDTLALALLGRTNIPIKDLIGSGKNQRTFDRVPLEQAGPYAAEDADVTLRLAKVLGDSLAREPKLAGLYRTLEMPLVDVLAAMERRGVLIDRRELANQEARLQERIDALAREIDEIAIGSIGRSFDLNSPKQLAAALFNATDDEHEGLGLTPIRKTKTGYSTDAEVLEKLAADEAVETPIPGLILEYRRLTKLVSTYLKALADDIHPRSGRIHAGFHQTVAATGRLSSSDPNLQNIPIRTDIGREIRKAFVAPEGHLLVTADYSQIELRVLAHLAEDPALIEAFERGEDIHRAVAAQIHGVALDEVTREQRSGAKMVNFGIVYGITPFGLARRLKVSNSEAGAIIDDYRARFPGITAFLDKCVEHARTHGYVQTMMGRRRPIDEIDARNPQRRALAERVAINSVVQGSAADLIKRAMIDLHLELVGAREGESLSGCAMILQIHDELVFECPEGHARDAQRVIVDRMERAADLRVPLVVDAAASRDWYGGK